MYRLLAAVLTAIYVAIVVGLGAMAGYAWGPTSPSLRRWPSRCCSSRCGVARSASRTASSTAIGPRPTRCCRSSPMHGDTYRSRSSCDRMARSWPSGTGARPRSGVDPGRAEPPRRRGLAGGRAPVPDAVDDDERLPDGYAATLPRSARGTSCSARSSLRKPRNEPALGPPRTRSPRTSPRRPGWSCATSG